MGLIEHKNSPFWQYDFVIGKTRYTGSTKETDYKKAEVVLIDLMNRVHKGEEIRKSGGNRKFCDFVESRVLPDVRLNLHEKPLTIKFYEGTYKRIAADPLGQLPLNKITIAEIKDFSQRCRKQGLEVATINLRLACIRKALRIAQEEDILFKIPKIKMVPGANRRERILVGDERAEFLSGMSDSLRPATEFAFETGLRITELCTLTKDRVSLDGPIPYIKIPRTISKSKEDRFVPLNPLAHGILIEEMMKSKSNFVFTRYGNKVKGLTDATSPQKHNRSAEYRLPISRHTLSHAFTKRAEQMGITGLVFHSTRHSAATEVGAAGANLFTLMSAFGWKSPDIAKRYVHPMQDDVAQVFMKAHELKNQKRLTAGSGKSK